MKCLVRTAGLAALAFSVFLSACSSEKSNVATDKTKTPDISGRWSGSFVATMPDGQVQRNTAMLILTQNGNDLGGTVGESEHKQSPIKDGTIDGRGIGFKIDMDGGKSMAFQLRLEGDHLKGEASGETSNGKMIGAIDAIRVKTREKPVAPRFQVLFKEISELDDELFRAFNKADLETMGQLFSEDLEFYHDKGGLTDFVQNMANLKKMFDRSTKVRRELIEGTLEVYPLHEVGAVATGVHRFYETESGQTETLGATAKFANVWRKKDGQWKLARVISYDHQ